MSGVKGRSGRKKKIAPFVDTTADMHDYGLVAEVEELRCVKKAKLSKAQKAAIAARLNDIASCYVAIRRMTENAPSRSGGRKQNVHRQILLYDCAKLWFEMTGKTGTKYVNAPSVQLARGVLKAVGEVETNLRRACAGARKWGNLPTPEGTQQRAMHAQKQLSLVGMLTRAE